MVQARPHLRLDSPPDHGSAPSSCTPRRYRPGPSAGDPLIGCRAAADTSLHLTIHGREREFQAMTRRAL